MITIYKCLRGSHAQGVAGPKSDKDYFEIVLPPIEAVLGLEEMVGSQHIKDGVDIRTITLREFLRQIINGRSTELEVLFANPEHQLEINSVGLDLLQNRDKLISQCLFKALLGFYTNQKHRMFKGNNEKLGYDPKMAAHCIRAIWQAINLKYTGRLDIYIDSNITRQEILSVKNGVVSLDSLQKIIARYDELYALAPDNKSIKPLPDYNWANNFLIGVYRETYCN